MYYFSSCNTIDLTCRYTKKNEKFYTPSRTIFQILHVLHVRQIKHCTLHSNIIWLFCFNKTIFSSILYFIILPSNEQFNIKYCVVGYSVKWKGQICRIVNLSKVFDSYSKQQTSLILYISYAFICKKKMYA